MAHITAILNQQLFHALKIIATDYPDATLPTNCPQVQAISQKTFGDYQSNLAMQLAKPLRQNPRAIAEKIVALLQLPSDVADISIAGAGFINFTLTDTWFCQELNRLLSTKNIAVESMVEKETIIIDFSSPNIAKPMHVGHIRSTIIGDSLSRIATLIGHRVIKDNHLGDWGTQFGKILYGWKHFLDQEALAEDALVELLRLYKKVNTLADNDTAVAEQVKQELIKLQQGDEENKTIWQHCVDLSKKALNEIYQQLDIGFDHWLGESFYNEQIAPLLAQLENANIAQKNDGALCIFSDNTLPPANDPFKINRNDQWQDLPMIIQKSDGGFNYASTDIATLFYRKNTLQADRILYVVDARQANHFQQLFQLWSRLEQPMHLHHVSFGTIQGKDGKPFRTRTGDLPQLNDLIQQAKAETRQLILAKNSPYLTAENRDSVIDQIAIGALKFGELSHHRSSDYNFDLKQMISLQGDTAPYLQNAYVRTQSILRKAAVEQTIISKQHTFQSSYERDLIRLLIRFNEVIHQAWQDYKPHLIAQYLLDVAKLFHGFFENCPVLNAEKTTKATRLALCQLTGKTLQLGLHTLGIATPTHM